MKKFKIILVVLLTLLIGIFEAAAEGPVVVKVKRGDTLGELCQNYLDNPQDCSQVAKINRLANPDQIFPSEYLIIPIELLKGIPIQGKITHLQGKVELLTDPAHNKWQPAELHSSISQGQQIRTLAESSVEISYPDEVVFFLQENSLVRVVKTRQKSQLNRVYDFFLDIGRSTSKIRKATGKTNRYQISTPTAVAGARGTKYRVNVDAKDNTRLEVLEGNVKVNAGKQVLQVNSGHGTLVAKGSKVSEIVALLPPSAPFELLPLYRKMPLQFSFSPVESARSLRIFFASDPEMRNIVKEKLIKATETFEIVSVADGQYYMACCSVDAKGLEGPASDPVGVNVRINPLPPFVQSPQNYAEIKDNFCSLSWLRVSDAVGYHLQIAEDADFGTLVLEEKNYSNTTYTSGPLPYKSYYYRLSSIAEDGYQGVWSDISIFTLVPPPPSPVAEDPEITANNIQIRWQNLGKGISYRFQLSPSPDFMTLLNDQKTTEPQIIIVRPDKAGTYYSRIQAMDSDGYAGNFSAPQSFEIEAELSWWDRSLLMSYLAALGLIL